MKIEIGEVWISNGGFALEIIENMQDGWYKYEHMNGHCDGYVSDAALKRGFTKLECEA